MFRSLSTLISVSRDPGRNESPPWRLCRRSRPTPRLPLPERLWSSIESSPKLIASVGTRRRVQQEPTPPADTREISAFTGSPSSRACHRASCASARLCAPTSEIRCQSHRDGRPGPNSHNRLSEFAAIDRSAQIRSSHPFLELDISPTHPLLLKQTSVVPRFPPRLLRTPCCVRFWTLSATSFTHIETPGRRH